MTKTQDGVPLTHRSIIKLPRFHVKKSRDRACHVLSLIRLRLAFAASFEVCDMHTSKIFMILNHSLAFMLSFWYHFEKYPLNQLWAGCKLGSITFLVIEVPWIQQGKWVAFFTNFPQELIFEHNAPDYCIDLFWKLSRHPLHFSCHLSSK